MKIANDFFLSLDPDEQVSKYWNILALDGSNWQKIDLFYFQMDIEVSCAYCGRCENLFIYFLFCIRIGTGNRKYFAALRWLLEIFIA